MLIPSGSLWLMDPDRLAALVRESYARRTVTVPTPRQLADRRDDIARGLRRREQQRIAVIPIKNTIEHTLSFWGYIMGSTPLDLLQEAVSAAAADPAVAGILLDVDSPGGSAYAVPEAADTIRAATKRKPVVAVANPFAGSAAYWLAAAATELVAVPSGDVGSIGVYVAHAEYSGALEKEGVKVNIIRKPPGKVEANDVEPLTPAARQHIQQGVDDMYAEFTGAVARFRGTTPKAVQDNYGQGRMVPARKALAAGMVDRIEPLPAAAARLARDAAGGARSPEDAQLRAYIERVTLETNQGRRQADTGEADRLQLALDIARREAELAS